MVLQGHYVSKDGVVISGPHTEQEANNVLALTGADEVIYEQEETGSTGACATDSGQSEAPDCPQGPCRGSFTGSDDACDGAQPVASGDIEAPAVGPVDADGSGQ